MDITIETNNDQLKFTGLDVLFAAVNICHIFKLEDELALEEVLYILWKSGAWTATPNDSE
jgi:hypothetical protein